jgi:hypothetical protein
MAVEEPKCRGIVNECQKVSKNTTFMIVFESKVGEMNKFIAVEFAFLDTKQTVVGCGGIWKPRESNHPLQAVKEKPERSIEWR